MFLLFNVCFPQTSGTYTTDKFVALEWAEKGNTIFYTPCGGGIDDHEHSVYCGCAGHGVFNTSGKGEVISKTAIKNI